MLMEMKAFLMTSGSTMCDFAQVIEGRIANQTEQYLIPNKDVIESKLLKEISKVSDALNSYDITTNATFSMPLAEEYDFYNIVQAYMASTVFMITFFLVMISIMLIFSLMLSDVEGKTFEYGILRTLGFKKRNLISMVSLKSLSFAIPGLTMGLIIAFIFNIAIKEKMYMMFNNTNTYLLSREALVLGITLGLILPFVTNYFPV